jgi:predicted O-methyltransferase YrrM
MKETKIIDERIALTQCESEFEALLEEYIKLKAKNVLEIGSYFGSSLHHWLYYSTEGARIISVDLPIKEFCGPQDPRVPIQEFVIQTEWRLWTKRNKNKLHLIPSASQLETTKAEVVKLLDNQLLDFLFIDGNHMLEAVTKDFEMYSGLVRAGGIIALHDIGKAEEGGVHILWDNLKKNHKTLEILHHPKSEKGIGIVFVE